MQIDRKNALKFWEAAFGKAVEAVDFSGRKINKSAYDQKSSKFGWVLSLVMPKSQGGRENPDNIICLHVLTADEKGDDYPVFVANETKYRITGAIEEQSGWLIEEAIDDETIAEQEAKNAAAIERWNELFGETYEKAVDFCGRMIHKSEFCTDSEYAWKVAPYVESKPMDNKNAYIANVQSIEEALGKTAFKANGKSFTLNKDNGAYYFKALEVKPPKKQFNIKDPYDLVERVGDIKEKCESAAQSGVMLDFLVIRAVTKPGCTSASAAAVADTVSAVLSESVGEWLSLETSEMIDQNGARYMFMTYRFASPQPSDFERVFMGAKLLNTYSPMLLALLGIDELKIYDYACFVDCAHKNYPVSLLSGYYPQLRALMESVYGSAYGFYEGECTTTLYVSHFIVFNVPSLAEMYPEGATQYFTEAELVEHNYPIEEVSGAIRRMFSGEPDVQETPVVSEANADQAEATEPETAVATEQEERVADASSVEVIAVAENEPAQTIEEPAEEPASEPLIAPVTEETAENLDVEAEVSEAEKAELKESKQEIEEAEEEAVAEKPEETDSVEEESQNRAQMMANALASALASNEEAPAPAKAPAFPEINNEPMTEPKPDETEENSSDDEDGVVTLDLDSIF